MEAGSSQRRGEPGVACCAAAQEDCSARWQLGGEERAAWAAVEATWRRPQCVRARCARLAGERAALPPSCPCSFVATKKKIVGKGGQRWYKNIGLGFKTPKEAIEGERGRGCHVLRVLCKRVGKGEAAASFCWVQLLVSARRWLFVSLAGRAEKVQRRRQRQRRQGRRRQLPGASGSRLEARRQAPAAAAAATDGAEAVECQLAAAGGEQSSGLSRLCQSCLQLVPRLSHARIRAAASSSAGQPGSGRS